jgi:hypothetical protein
MKNKRREQRNMTQSLVYRMRPQLKEIEGDELY